MRRAIVLLTLGVLASAAAAAEDGPKLVKQKLIVADDGKAGVAKVMHSARLSPDGKHLLYMRVKWVQLPARDGRPARERRSYRLILRELKSGKDKPLPIPAYMNGEIATAMLSGNIFGLGGKKIALGAGIDDEGDGLHDYLQEKMQAVVYDIASGKLTKLPVTDRAVFGTFDRTGKGLIIMTMGGRDERHGKLLTTPLDNPKLRQFGKWGLPRGVCPAGDVLALLLPQGRGGKRLLRFILYDLKAGKQIAELPTHEENRKLDDSCPQWTSDGRYLYYADVKYEMIDGKRERKVITRIWDRTKSREAGIVPDVVPIGPGPGKGTMVVAKSPGLKQMFLHDAGSGASHSLGKVTMNAIAAEGKYLLYADKPADGKSGIYMAEIVPAKKEKPAKEPAGKKGPGPKPRAVK